MMMMMMIMMMMMMMMARFVHCKDFLDFLLVSARGSPRDRAAQCFTICDVQAGILCCKTGSV